MAGPGQPNQMQKGTQTLQEPVQKQDRKRIHQEERQMQQVQTQEGVRDPAADPNQERVRTEEQQQLRLNEQSTEQTKLRSQERDRVHQQ